MKWTVICRCLVAVVSASALTSFGLTTYGQENAIRNGDFEQGQIHWVLPTPPDGIKISIDKQKPLSGKCSLRLEGTKVSAFIIASQFGINLEGGREYVLRFKYRWQRGDSVLYTLEPRFGVTGADGKLELDQYICFTDFRDLTSASGEVGLYERRFSVPVGYTAVFFQFFCSGNWGTIWIDDISVTVLKPGDERVPMIEQKRKKPPKLKKAPYSLEGNLMSNGGFEEGVAGWSIPGASEGAKTSLEEDEPLVGKMSLKMEGKKVGEAQVVGRSLSLPAGQYVLRFLYQWERQEGAIYTALPRFGLTTSDGRWKYVKFSDFRNLKPTDYKVETYERRFSVPEGHTATFFQFFFVGCWGTLWIDEVCISVAKQEDERVPKAEDADEKPF